MQKVLDRGGCWYFPKGVYVLGTLKVPANTHLQFAPGAVYRVNPTEIKDRLCIVLQGDDITLEGIAFDPTDAAEPLLLFFQQGPSTLAIEYGRAVIAIGIPPGGKAVRID